MANNQEMQVILRAALQAYEHARASFLHAERQAKAQLDQTAASLTAAQQTERRDLEAAQKGRLAVAGGEQARIGDLASAVSVLEDAARNALAQAGLAHIAGAPAAVDSAPAQARRGDADVAAVFVQAQTSYVALREAIYHLAMAQVDAGQWEHARQTLHPLLANNASPFFGEAFDVQRTSYLRPAQQALEAERWEDVRTTLEPWLKQHKDDPEAQTIYRESYYRPAAAALDRKDWAVARTALAALNKYRAGYKDAAELERQSYLRPAQEALEVGQWELVRTTVKPWLEKKQDEVVQTLVWESHYRGGQQAAERKDWPRATLEWALAVGQKGNFRDVQSLLINALRNGLDAIAIPAGDFQYGDGKASGRLSLFRISRAPITNIQYKAFVDATHGTAPSHWDKGVIPYGKENHPIVNVSWDDAQAFCKWAGLRLPSEQEWEKAARGTDGRTYPWGNQAPSGDLCNFNNIVGGTSPVGNYPKGASPYGLLDMAGNVWEWCGNAHESGGYVIRGGAYDSNASRVGCAYRDRGYLNPRDASLGFRVVCP